MSCPAPATSEYIEARSTPWRDRPFQRTQNAAEIIGLSVPSIYKLAREGRLVLKRLGGRTLVETGSLIALMDAAEDWVPSDRTGKAVAKRIEQSRAGWADADALPDRAVGA